MDPQLFHDLAASEESSGYPDNARALRAVPDLIEAVQYLIMHQPGTVKFDTCWPINCNAARAALAAMEPDPWRQPAGGERIPCARCNGSGLVTDTMYRVQGAESAYCPACQGAGNTLAALDATTTEKEIAS